MATLPEAISMRENMSMKRQYYADARDVAKWSTLVHLAKEGSLRTIIQIALLTPDDTTNQGLARDDPLNADPAVARFFTEERKRLVGHHVSKQIDRVVPLGKQLTPPLTIEVISEPFVNRNRQAYFEEVCAQISSFDRPVVAFADPDKGIAPGRPSAKHVTTLELRSIWSTLKPGSTLVVFQYQQRVSDWVNICKSRLASGLEVDPKIIGVIKYAHVSFLFTRKSLPSGS